MWDRHPGVLEDVCNFSETDHVNSQLIFSRPTTKRPIFQPPDLAPHPIGPRMPRQIAAKLFS
ncbi:hypothetical protein D3C87_109160 [compost metagenome]